MARANNHHALLDRADARVGAGRIRPHAGTTGPLAPTQTPAPLEDMLDRRVAGTIVVRVCD